MCASNLHLCIHLKTMHPYQIIVHQRVAGPSPSMPQHHHPTTVHLYLRMVHEKVAGSSPSVPQTSTRGGTINPNENIHTPLIISKMLDLTKLQNKCIITIFNHFTSRTSHFPCAYILNHQQYRFILR